MKLILMAAAVALAAGAAHAAPVSFSWDEHIVNRVEAPAEGGKMVGAVFLELHGQVITGGQTIPITGQCASWTMPKSSTFERNGVCMLNGANGGRVSYLYGCDWDADHKGQSCWAYVEGLAGPPAKAKGEASFHIAVNPDVTGGHVEGSGEMR
ncbi:MAG: hypothetical protein ACRED9_12185 [Caulobacteraceae bacterium]